MVPKKERKWLVECGRVHQLRARVKIIPTAPLADSQLYSNFLHMQRPPYPTVLQAQVIKPCQTEKRHHATVPPLRRGTRDLKSRNPAVSNGKRSGRATTTTRPVPHRQKIQTVSTAAIAIAPLVHATTTATPNAREPISPAPPIPVQTRVPAHATTTHSIAPAAPSATDLAKTLPRTNPRKRNPPSPQLLPQLVDR